MEEGGSESEASRDDPATSSHLKQGKHGLHEQSVVRVTSEAQHRHSIVRLVQEGQRGVIDKHRAA